MNKIGKALLIIPILDIVQFSIDREVATCPRKCKITLFTTLFFKIEIYGTFKLRAKIKWPTLIAFLVVF